MERTNSGNSFLPLLLQGRGTVWAFSLTVFMYFGRSHQKKGRGNGQNSPNNHLISESVAVLTSGGFGSFAKVVKVQIGRWKQLLVWRTLTSRDDLKLQYFICYDHLKSTYFFFLFLLDKLL